MSKSIVRVIRGRVEERRNKYATREVRKLPDSKTLKESYLPGTYSVVVPARGERFIRKPDCLPVGGLLETPTTLARDYLLGSGYKSVPLRGPARAGVWEVINRNPSFPLYVRPAVFEEGYYLDIHRAFWSIMLVCGWNVSYCPGKWLAQGTAPRDFPFADSPVARNALVSCALPHDIVRVDPVAVYKRFQSANPILNTSISALIRDVLHSIAALAVRVGAVYVNMDGYIAPDPGAAERIGQVIRDYGLTYSVKGEGRGLVVGPGLYRVGKTETHGMGRAAPARSATLNHVAEVSYGEWLQQRFARMAVLSYPAGVK